MCVWCASRRTRKGKGAKGRKREEEGGEGGGEETSKRLSALVGTDVPLLGKIAFNPELRTGGDDGVPLVQAAPESESAQTILAIAEILVKRSKSLVGVRLGISPESN